MSAKEGNDMRKLTKAEARVILAMVRGQCGKVSPSRVWCDADRVATLYHVATFERLAGRSLAADMGPLVGWVLTGLGCSKIREAQELCRGTS